MLRPSREPRDRSIRRRDLFRPRQGSAVDPARPEALAGRFDLIRAERAAMGSYFEVRIPARTPGGLDLVDRVLDTVDALEAQLTVYRDDSEISRLNATAHLGPVEVEAGLFDLLARALAIGSATGGAYDVAAGALSAAWGFTRGPRRVPEREALAEARARTGQHLLRLDPERRTVAFDRPGVVLNLGSIGKGYAIDRAVAVIRDHWWATPALVHGGRSSLYALGSPPGEFGGRWEVALRNPFDPEQPLGTIRLRNRGMGTSGGDFQRFEVDGRTYGHILDPRTGEPAQGGPAGVTVLAPTAAEADALSTACYLLGAEGSAPLLAGRPDVGAIFVEAAADGGPPSIRTINLTEDDFVALPVDPDRPPKFRP